MMFASLGIKFKDVLKTIGRNLIIAVKDFPRSKIRRLNLSYRSVMTHFQYAETLFFLLLLCNRRVPLRLELTTPGFKSQRSTD